MFISKEELEKIIEKYRYDKVYDDGFMTIGGFTVGELYEKLNKLNKCVVALEEYLDIHYEEKTTKGYVKNKKK